MLIKSNENYKYTELKNKIISEIEESIKTNLEHNINTKSIDTVKIFLKLFNINKYPDIILDNKYNIIILFKDLINNNRILQKNRKLSLIFFDSNKVKYNINYLYVFKQIILKDTINIYSLKAVFEDYNNILKNIINCDVVDKRWLS